MSAKRHQLSSPSINNQNMAKKKKKQNSVAAVIEFIKKDRARFIFGVTTFFLGAFLLLGCISFFFTGAADQSKVLNKFFTDLVWHKQPIDNWTGVIGAFVSETLINQWFGIFAVTIPVFMVFAGLRLMRVIRTRILKSFLLLSFFLIWGSVFSSFLLTRLFGNSYINWGGGHGQHIESVLEAAIGIPGVLMLIIFLFMCFIVIVNKASVGHIRSLFTRQEEETEEDDITYDEEPEEELNDRKGSIRSKIKSFFGKAKGNESEDKAEDPIQPKGSNKGSIEDDFSFTVTSATDQVSDGFEIVVPEEEEYVAPTPVEGKNNPMQEDTHTFPSVPDDENLGVEELDDYDPTKDLSSFQFPSMDLLRIYDSTGKGVNMEEQNANKNKIITTLLNYGIEITSIKATVGPTITLYEIVPKAGVRISKIRNLEDDIALSLSALGIRIIAPMPGKGTIGIEVPNKDAQIVSMQSVIASKRFQECPYDLPVALGKTITNDIFMFDLCKMPHLLVAGATGQGKSVGLNAIITSLLYKKHPAEMKMVLVDPKMVEFNIYSTIEKHYLAKLPDAEKAIITDVTKVTQTLHSLTKEMDDRYELLMNAGVRNIKEYNEKFRKRKLNPLKGHKFLPYIVVIIDEFGDLIMTAGKEIEMPIARIAQKARAVGMHMVIATQRPTTNIITGTIKANFPARMAFRVTSQIDSRTILDTSGANQLIGRGDMLFSQGSDLIRIQCAFVDTPEVEEITQYIGRQQGYAHAFDLPEYVAEGSEDKFGSIDAGDRDPLFEEAARLIVVHQQGSTSLIQRKFSIGYNRAGRLMDQLEAAGIVGPTQGSKPRDVLIMDEYSLEQKLSQ